MEYFVFAGFVVLQLLAYVRIRSGLDPKGRVIRSGPAAKSPQPDPKAGGRKGTHASIGEFVSLMTLGIALTCLMTGLIVLVPRPAASARARPDDSFFLMAITGIGVVLTLATWAGAIIGEALLATVRTTANIIEAILESIRLSIRQTWHRGSPKPARISSASGGVVDDWLDGP